MEDIANELTAVVDMTAEQLKSLDEALVRMKPSPEKWSIQEILGHLVDSASNNHHRFVRAQHDEVLVFPKYEQDLWVSIQDYNNCCWSDVIELWRLYNRQLAHVITQVMPEQLHVECRIGSYDPVTLLFLIEDYLAHLKHHLQQIQKQSRPE